MSKQQLSAVVMGATGAVGMALVRRLIEDDDFARVHLFVRRDCGLCHPKLTQTIEADSSRWASDPSLVADVLFCALGSTKKIAGSLAAQYQFDVTLPLTLAKAATNNGVKKIVVISSIGAKVNARSPYLAMKGALEQGLINLNPQQLSILRPSLLLAKRPQFRLAEGVAAWLAPLLCLFPPLRPYRPIPVEQVAKKMISCSKTDADGVHILESKQLFED